MPISRTYECPDCQGSFRFLHMKSDEPPPPYCPLCGRYMSGVPEARPSSPSVSKSTIAKTTDRLHREMEDASAVRAALADSLLPAAAGDNAAALKLTDIPSSPMVPSSSTVTPMSSPVVQAMSGMTNGSGIVSPAVARGYASQAGQGPGAGMGAAMLGATTQGHRDIVAKVIAAASVGR